MSAREFIERVEALAGAATEGEWWHTGKAATVYGRWADDLSSAPHVANVHDPADAEFIAASRTVVPQLTAALRAVLDLADEYSTQPEYVTHAPGDFSGNDDDLVEWAFDKGYERGIWLGVQASLRAITDALGGEQA